MKDLRMSFKVQVGPAQIAIHQGQTVLLTETDGRVNWPSKCGLHTRDTVTLEQTVDEVKAAWTARARARGKFAAQKSVRAPDKSPCFLMSNMHPAHLLLRMASVK
jgi:hypothetical protein